MYELKLIFPFLIKPIEIQHSCTVVDLLQAIVCLCAGYLVSVGEEWRREGGREVGEASTPSQPSLTHSQRSMSGSASASCLLPPSLSLTHTHSSLLTSHPFFYFHTMKVRMGLQSS